MVEAAAGTEKIFNGLNCLDDLYYVVQREIR